MVLVPEGGLLLILSKVIDWITFEKSLRVPVWPGVLVGDNKRIFEIVEKVTSISGVEVAARVSEPVVSLVVKLASQ